MSHYHHSKTPLQLLIIKKDNLIATMNYDKRFQNNVHVFLPVQKKTTQTLKPLAVHAHYILRMIHPVHTRYYFTITGRTALSHKTRAKKPQQSNNQS